MSEPRSYAMIVRAGANLPAEDWPDERVVAITKYLPEKFQNAPAQAIAFLTLARKYELDPFSGELFAIQDDRGQMKLIVPRDGLIKIAKRDPKVLGHSAAIVYEGDKFSWANVDGRIEIRHESENVFGSERPPLGAYCVVYMAGDEPDQIVVRRMSDYGHLLNSKKFNWKMYPQDMILARVISAAYRLKVSLGGIYTEADFDLTEDPHNIPAAQAQDRTAEKLEAMKADLEVIQAIEERTEMVEPEIIEGAIEIVGQELDNATIDLHVKGEVGAEDEALFNAEAEVVVKRTTIKMGEAMVEIPDEREVESDYPVGWEDREAEVAEAPVELEDAPDNYPCPVCDRPFASPQALGGHLRTHSAEEKRAAGIEPVGVQRVPPPVEPEGGVVDGELEPATEPEEDRDTVVKRLMVLYEKRGLGLEERNAFQDAVLPMRSHPEAWDLKLARVSIRKCTTENLVRLERELLSSS